jgi:hypothetical protein
VFVLPYDETLRSAGPLNWTGLAPATRDAVLDVAEALAAPLAATPTATPTAAR